MRHLDNLDALFPLGMTMSFKVFIYAILCKQSSESFPLEMILLFLLLLLNTHKMETIKQTRSNEIN